MLKAYSIVQRKVTEDPQGKGQVLVYVSPTEEERRELVSRYLIDEHTLASALDPDEPARVEQEPDHTALIFKRPRNYSADERFLFKVSSMGLFLYADKLIVILSEDLPLFAGRPFSNVDRIEDVFLKILSASIYHYLEHLKIINQITDEIEQLIGRSMENKYLLSLFSLEKSLVYYLSAINSNGYVLEKLRASVVKTGTSTTFIELLDDLIIESTQCYKQAEIHSNILANLMDARVSIVSNNLNILMKTLNLVTIFIMVPTFVVSAFSMNIKIPFENHPNAFWIILSLASLSVISVMIWWITFSAKLSKNGITAHVNK